MALLQACHATSTTNRPYSLPSLSRPARSSSCRAATSLSAQSLKRACPPSIRFGSSFFNDSNLLKVRRQIAQMKGGDSATTGGACTAVSSVALSGEALRWVFAGAAALIIFLKNTAINKSILVPLVALQAPRDAVTWIRGEYGLWAAFLALLVRLFYQIPGELELPLVFALLVITAPRQALDFRGTTAALVVSAAVAAYLAYQHFEGAGGVKESFKERTILTSLAVIVLVAVPVVFFFGGF